LTVVDTKTLGLILFKFNSISSSPLGTWLKQRHQEQNHSINDEDNRQLPNLVAKSSESSSANSVETSESDSDICGGEIYPKKTHFRRTRSYSATLRGQRLLPDKPSIIKEVFHNYSNDEHSQQPITPLTKSTLIYRLMRSRLEANLAKSITNNKRKNNSNNKLSYSTNH